MEYEYSREFECRLHACFCRCFPFHTRTVSFVCFSFVAMFGNHQFNANGTEHEQNASISSNIAADGILCGYKCEHNINDSPKGLEESDVFNWNGYIDIFICTLDVEALNYMTRWFRIIIFENIQMCFLNPSELALVRL